MINRFNTFFRPQRFLILLYALIVIAICVVRPTGEFPLNDDWSWAKTIKNFLDKGHYDPGSWPAMSLVTHLIWGYLFVKVFGFSFFVLRLSTIVSMLIGITVFNQLLTRWSGSKKTAFFGSLTLFFAPCFFSLSFTYMTDVNFLVLLILCWKFADDFFRNHRWLPFILFFILSLALVMLRQFGLIAPASMVFACLLIRHNRWRFVVASVAFTGLIVLVLKFYEGYLFTIIPENANYERLESHNIFDLNFWIKLGNNIVLRYRSYVIELLIYSFPVLIAFFPSVFRSYNRWFIIGLLLLVSFLVYRLFNSHPLQTGNIFYHMSLGPDTFYECRISPGIRQPHTYSNYFMDLLSVIKYSYLSLSITALIIILLGKLKPKTKQNILRANPLSLFFFVFFFGYTFLLFVSHLAFDRYHLPLLAMVVVFVGAGLKEYKPVFSWAIVPLLMTAYLCVGGTHDYMRTNEKRWEAYHFAREHEMASPEDINGGFEINGWNEGKPSDPFAYIRDGERKYIIQYRVEENYKVVKEFPYQRLFPFKQDTVRLMKLKKSSEKRE